MTRPPHRVVGPRRIFHSVENFFPHCGKLRTARLLAVLGLGLALPLPRTGAALPDPPPLPFPLPAADLRPAQTTTLYSPDTFLHLAELNRPLSDADLAQFDSLLARRNWCPIASGDASAGRDLLDRLADLAPTPDVRQPFLAATALLQQGMRIWTLDPVQLVYAPGNPATLTISFPPAPDDAPATPGAFTADLPLPIHSPRFIQAVIQSNASQIIRIETWESPLPPGHVLNQAEPMLIAAGWTPPLSAIPDTQHPEHRALRNRLRQMETQFQNLFRVYHRGTAQLSLLYIPEEPAAGAPPAHRYSLMLRTLLAWPPPENSVAAAPAGKE